MRRTSRIRRSAVSRSRFDETHSHEKGRFIAVGPIRRGIVLVVWTEREEGITRIISARSATKRERTAYRSFMDQQR